jgi:hypothetical protein
MSYMFLSSNKLLWSALYPILNGYGCILTNKKDNLKLVVPYKNII